MSILIRDPKPSDSPAIVDLVGEVQALHVASRPETFRPVPKPEIASWLGQALQNPAHKIWVAELDGAVCGYLLSVARKQAGNPFMIDRTWLDLDGICVQRAYRRHGIAKALVATAIAYAEAQGFRDVELSTWAFNHDAQSAFKELGFVAKVLRFEAKISFIWPTN